MIIVGLFLLYLGIKKDFEPLLLVPIGFGCILVNIPLAGLMEEEGFLKIIYDAGIITELFPLLIFVGIGAMTDFGPALTLNLRYTFNNYKPKREGRGEDSGSFESGEDF